MIKHLALGITLLASTAALAADLGARKPTPASGPGTMCKETRALPADAFGFATGSDVADLGSWAASLDTSGTKGYRGATAGTLSPTLQVSGSFFPCLEIGPYLTYGYQHFKPYGGTVSKTNSFVGGVELKYKLLGRAQNGIGLTLAVSPNGGGADTTGVPHQKVFGNAFRLLADGELVKGRLYGAANIELFQTIVDSGTFGVGKASFLNVRGALTTPVSDALYLGGEASYQRAYMGTWLNRYAGQAYYVGPTFFWQISDKFSLNGTWAYQVGGSARISPGRALGIDIFPRHNARLKLAYAF